MSSEPAVAGWRGVGDAVAFSGVWVATAAMALAAAAAATFGAGASPALLAFAGAGTFCVYAVDRLRDLARDRDTMPRRSAFVARHRPLLALASLVAGLVAAVAGAWLGAAALGAAAVAGGLGLGHRRLKGIPVVKGLYVAASWTVVTVLLPACLASPPPARATVGWAVAIVGPALLANAIAASARDREAVAALFGIRRAVGAAFGLALAASLAGVAAPPPARALTPIALATALAVAAFRAGDRYERLLDGALVLGAVIRLLQ